MARLSVRGLGATPGSKFTTTQSNPVLMSAAYTGIAMTQVASAAGAGSGGTVDPGSSVTVSDECRALIDDAYAECPELATHLGNIEEAYLMCDSQGADLTLAQLEAVGCTRPWYMKWQTWALVGGVAAAGLLIWKLKR